MNMKFLTGEPALLIGRALVIADLHLGAERDYRAAGIRMPSQAGKAEAKIEHLLRETKARRLIILGDVKHRVPGASFQEEREVPALLSRLAKGTPLRGDETRIQEISIEVVPGNHDGGLERLAPDITMHPSEGLRVGNFWLCHGHAWPPKDALSCEAVVMGHNHPQVEFADRLGKRWREKVWVRAPMKRKLLKAHYNMRRMRHAGSPLPELLLMPAFGELVGGWAVNRPNDDGKLVGGLGPMTRCADIKHGLAYMLDGTFLGEVSKI